MRSFAKHLGQTVLILGAFALMGAAPNSDRAASPARSPQVTKKAPAKAPVATTTHKAKKATVAATPVAAKPAPSSAAMRIYRDPDTDTPVGLQARALIPYVEPTVAEVGQPVLHVKPDGSLEMELNGTGEETAIMSIAPNGTLQFRCVQAASKPAKTAPVAPSVPQPEER
jgi:hypothetical protein